jgi:predicted transcriptional regulator
VQKWGWFPWLYRLANGDITKLEEILKMPHGTVYIWLAFEIDKNTMEQNDDRRSTK